MKPLALFLAVVLASALCTGIATADTRPTSALQHNPFKRPTTPSAPVPIQARPQQNAIQDLTSGAEKPARMRLIGTLSAGTDSLANIDGTILELGDQIRGFRLLSVGEGSAILLRNNARVTLEMDYAVRDALE